MAAPHCAPDPKRREYDPLLASPRKSEIRPLLHACVFGGGFYALPVSGVLPVFLGPKIAAAPDGFSLEVYSASQSLVFAGWACSAALVVPYSDIIGRKPVLIGLVSTALAAQAVALHAKTTTMFQALHFFVGFLASASQVSYIVCQESLTPMQRSSALWGLNVVCSSLTVLLALGCEFLTQELSWQVEVLTYFSPYFFLLLCLPFSVKETLRTRAPACDLDGITPKSPPGTTSSAIESADTVLFGNEYRPRVICTCICWMATATSFYGLSFSAGQLSADIYKNVLLLAVTDLAGNCIAGAIVAWFGILLTQMMSYACAGAVLLCISFMQAESSNVIVGAMLGRFCLNVTFFTVYLLLVEHFPMEIRSTAGGRVNFVARAAAMTAPLCTLLPVSTSCSAMGGFCLVAAMATYHLPEVQDTASGIATK